MKKTICSLLIVFCVMIYSNEVKRTFDEAVSLIKENKMEEALLKFRQVYVQYPRSSYAEQSRYNCAFYAPDLFQQNVEYKDFVQMYPNSKLREEAYYYIAMNNYIIKNFKEAQEYFEKYMWNFATGQFIDSVNFYLGIIARENRELDLYFHKLSYLSRDEDNQFHLFAVYLLRNFYNLKGIREKALEMGNLLKNEYPPIFEKRSNEFWTVQVGAFSNSTNAQKFTEELKKKGFPDTFFEREGNFFRVFSGIFLTKQEADLFLKDITEKGYEGRTIKKN